ncbi:TPA: hypothetical protein NHJ38_003116 [Legionella pneumophila]|nr:hypothetical protein [Legionella pneumophila]HCE5577514.1 hypothetical protein [Legionella pneumophila]HCE5599028.1 hypothetical protein [Legionella pneumophila]
MNEYYIIFVLGLFPGLLFSTLYLREVPEISKTIEVKLISIQSIFAVIYGTCFLSLCIILDLVLNGLMVINGLKPLSKVIHPTSLPAILLCFLILYLISFYIAFRLGNFLCNIKYCYAYFTTNGRWNKLFSTKLNTNYFITTVVETGGETWLYIGMLDDYVTNQGELDLIQLRRPYRRLVKGKESSKKKSENQSLDRFYRIDVDVLSIRYLDVRSLGIRSITVK